MPMNSKVLMIAVLAALVGGLVWMVRTDSPDPRTDGRSPPSTSSPSAPSSEGPGGGAPTRTEALVTAPYEEEIPEIQGADPGTFETPPSEGRRILVVRKASGEPVAEATVLVLEPDSFTPEESSRIVEEGAMDYFEGTMRRYGKRYRTDGAGIALIPYALDAVIAASKGELWGIGMMQGLAEDPVRIAIEPSKVVRVLVVDGKGRPVPGVPVTAGGSEGGPTLSTDQGGSLAFKNLHQTMEAAGVAKQLAVSFALPLRDGPSVMVDPWDPPQDPVRLVLPDTGRVVVTAVDGQGVPFESGHVQLIFGSQEEPPGESDPGSHLVRVSRLEDGRAVFPFVDLGFALTAILHRDFEDPIEARAEGPKEPGEEVLVRVASASSRSIIVGRAVDAQGAPRANTKFLIEVTIAETSFPGFWTLQLSSDGDGFLRIPIADDWEAGAVRGVWLGQLDEGGESLEAEGQFDASRSYPEGETRVGDIRVARGPLLASGVVVDDLGRAVPLARVGAEGRTSSPSPELWYGIPGRTGNTDEEGRFEILGVSNVEDFRVTAAADGYLDARSEVLPAGASDVRLVLSRSGSLHGRLLLDPGVSAHRLRVSVTHLIQGVESERVTVRENGTFDLEGISPGPVQVIVHLPGEGYHSSPLSSGGRDHGIATVDGVQVIAGERNVDPRLTIDLRGRVHVITVGIHRPDGNTTQVLLEATDAKRRRIVTVVDGDGRGSLLTDALPLELSVSALGYRREARADVTEDVEITLRPGLTVDVQLLFEGPVPPPPLLVKVRLRLMERGVLPLNMTGLPSEAICGASGDARLVVGDPGSYELRLTLRKVERRAFSSARLGTEVSVDVRDIEGSQAIQVRVSAADLEKALSLLRAGR
jgi:hypothetical protein